MRTLCLILGKKHLPFAALLLLCALTTGCPPQNPVGPAAAFTAVVNGLTLTFTDTSLPGSEAITAWAWDFGDGGASTEQSPSHTYVATGTYAVSLTVTTAVGNDSHTAAMSVNSRRYVKPGSAGNGTSWGSAFGTIQAAVDAAFAAGGGDVWVAAGTYVDTLEAVVSMRSNVSVYGGFLGSEDSFHARDWGLNVTIIDGQATRRCVLGANDGILDGFTIRNGHGGYDGGGMLNRYDSSPTISNCKFVENSAYLGGGMYNANGSSPTVSNCKFVRNTAQGAGGGMYNFDSSPTVCSCTFFENAASVGGGMHNTSSSPTVDNCTFAGNTAEAGGGMRNDNSTSMLTISNSSFTENTADYGGGMDNISASPTLLNCTFAGNVANVGGGGMDNSSASPTVSNCTFFENTAYVLGGGMCNSEESSPTVLNCTFAENAARQGGGMDNQYSFPSLTNCTFFGNSASSGGGMWIFRGSLTMSNCILWADSAVGGGGEIYDFDSAAAVAVKHSCVEGGLSGAGNISADPLFVDAVMGDYRLQGGSPCIDSGTAEGAPDTDILGVLRPQGVGYDMGAYEYTGE